jgi:creatinine amidohydrolase
MKPNTINLFSKTYPQLKADPPNVVILPWGATEAHNNHLPYASDVIEATAIAEESAIRAKNMGAGVVVLPTIPFGNNAQHLDQSVTIHINTTTAYSLLRDIVDSLISQKIDRLLIVNSHGGNNFKPIVRDLQKEFPILIVVADILEMVPDSVRDLFDSPGDHAGELETSLMMYLTSGKIDINLAGTGKKNQFEINGLDQPGIWTPRPWSHIHPDTGSGNPATASIAKGEKYFNLLCDALSKTIFGLSSAKKGDLPYI